MIFQYLYMNMEETAAIVLFGIGSAILLLQRNLTKKIMGINIMNTAVYPFLATKGYIEGRTVSAMINGSRGPVNYINSIPSGLALTDIVVSVSVMALVLALTMRLYWRYGSLDLDKIIIEAREEEP